MKIDSGASNKRVILGCGYIGKALLEYWHHNKKNLVGTTTRAMRLEELEPLAGQVVVMQGDDRTALRKLLSGVKQIVICVAPKTADGFANVYLDTAKTLCDVLKEGTSVEQIVYTSSISVYGEHFGQWVTEETSLKPIGVKQEVLCETEALYLNVSSPNPIQVAVLRLGGIYGPNREHEKRCLQMSGKPLSGNGEEYSNWIHQEDAVHAIDWVLKRHLSGVYNVCSEDHPKRKELYDQLTTRLHLPPMQWDPTRSEGHSGNKKVSSEKLKKTGFSFHHSALI